MTVEGLLVYGKKNCHSDYAKILLGDLLGKNPLELLIYLNEEVPEEKVNQYMKEIEAIKDNKPLQYVIGNVNFYGEKFIINENVLIPRFETEELVENTINLAQKMFKDKIEIIDLGCGSGVIGLSLKRMLKNSDVTLVDISDGALSVTKENAINQNLKVEIIKNDMLDGIKTKFDIIISNPPYIKNNEQIEEIVYNNEPHIALYGGEDGLYYYNKILSNVKKNLKDNYLIAFEIGHTQAEDIKHLANHYLNDPNIIVKKDMQERDRMIFIYPKI